MRLWLLLLIASTIAANARPSDGADRWVWHRNDWLGYRFLLQPDLLELSRSSERGDGELFISPEGDARLLVGARLNRDGLRLGELAQATVRQSYSGFRVTYRRFGRGWFVLSGRDNHRIFYEKAFLTCAGSQITSFAMAYPVQQRSVYDRVVEQIERSFRPGASCALATEEPDRPAQIGPDRKQELYGREPPEQ